MVPCKDRKSGEQAKPNATDDTGEFDCTAVSSLDAPLDNENYLSDPMHKEAIEQAAQSQLDLSWYEQKFLQLKETYTFAEAKPGDVLTKIKITNYPKPRTLDLSCEQDKPAVFQAPQFGLSSIDPKMIAWEAAARTGILASGWQQKSRVSAIVVDEYAKPCIYSI